MKPAVLLIGAVVVLAIAFFAFQEADEGPAEQAGAAVDEAVNDAARTVEDATD